MKYLTPVYIKIDNDLEEICNRLEEIRYKRLYSFEGHDNWIIAGGGFYNQTNFSGLSHIGIETKDCHFCGNNIEMFIRLAAMNDTNDFHQVFVTETDQAWVNQGIYANKGSFQISLVDDRHMGKTPLIDNFTVPARKATKDEVISYAIEYEMMKKHNLSIGNRVQYRPYETCNKVDKIDGKIVSIIDDYNVNVLFDWQVKKGLKEPKKINIFHLYKL